MVKVLGLSNYHCKQLSHLLTRYGMDKTGKCRPLTELYQRNDQTFDCSVLGDRCFLINVEHVDVVGYGRDISGSGTYLADTLAAICAHDGGEERLLPIHADGDGHCLVHAISRALVGRELFWHPLRTSLKEHFAAKLDQYKILFHDFINDFEWRVIIDECDPDFEPPDGELLGLRNIHIFGLANVLKRPIILLDSLSGMQSCGDYAATFLPSLVDPDGCRGRSGELNKPLVIAWSSQGRNHYIPLVGVKNRPLPRLPRMLVPKAWGVSNDLVERYIDFDRNGYCIVGGDKYLHDNYVLKLVAAMEVIYFEKYGVHPAVVADVHHYIYKRTGVVGAKLSEVLEATRRATSEKRLYVCLRCSGVCEQRLIQEWFRKGGALYSLAETRHGLLSPDKLYSFPLQGVICTYDAGTDELVPNDKETFIEKCSWCHGSQIRLVNGDGTIQYQNGDRTKTRAQSSHCNCGLKHYWDGREYDNQPQIIPVILEWAGKVINEKVAWFEHEPDPALNSNVYQVADRIVQKHFPGVFGSERLVKKVVDQILEQTKQPEDKNTPQQQLQPAVDGDMEHSSPTSPQKIILSGYHVVHKEELIKSQAERTVHQRIVQNAAARQRRHSAERTTATTSQVKPATASTVSAPKDRDVHEHSSPSPTVNKMIRIVTSDGRQLRISMETGALTAASLLGRLAKELSIERPHLKKIMFGFPPKNLPLVCLDDGEEPLPFQPGDKVSIELATELNNSGPIELVGTEIGAMPMDTTSVLQRLQDIQNTGLDNLDASITSLMLTTMLTNQNVWSHVQQLPNLFLPRGLLYMQVQRDIGLVDGKHCRLSIVPDKIFCYNAERDRIELCLEPHGHFPVEAGVEERVLSSGSGGGIALQPSTSNVIHGVGELLQSGASGVCVNKLGGQVTDCRTAFFGHGYSLKNTSSNVEIGHDLEDKEEVMDADSRETQSIDVTVEPGSQSTELLRKGPGYSVLNSAVVASVSSTQEERDRRQSLASELQEHCSPDPEDKSMSWAASEDTVPDKQV